MSYYKSLLASICIILFGVTAHPARAQWAVVDVGAITQLVQQVMTMKEQLDTAKSHLEQAQKQYQATTGKRGMENLLAMTKEMRNYLPTDWEQLSATMKSINSTLGGMVQNTVNTNAVLTPAQLNKLAPEVRALLEAQRRSTALSQVMTRTALQNTSNRFQSIQQLINAIPTAGDEKAILDLQARIQVELGMLQNEQTKLQVLQQVSQAEESAQQQRAREYAVAARGRFATRFRPTI